jgi:hypothetical protein
MRADTRGGEAKGTNMEEGVLRGRKGGGGGVEGEQWVECLGSPKDGMEILQVDDKTNQPSTSLKRHLHQG